MVFSFTVDDIGFKWLLGVINSGGTKRLETLHEGVRCLTLAKSLLYLTSQGAQSKAQQDVNIEGAFVGPLSHVISIITYQPSARTS